MKRLLFVLLSIGAAALAANGQTAAQQEFFESKIRPVLSQQCYACHADEKMGGLRLDSKKAWQKSSCRAIPRVAC